ncbi:MAG: hypothetical protein AAF497_18770, partial [Planctomycetota bacterium]
MLATWRFSADKRKKIRSLTTRSAILALSFAFGPMASAQLFSAVSESAELVAPSIPVDLGFGENTPDVKDVDFGDLDGDGDLDIYIFAS